MRKVVTYTLVSVDGVAEDPDQFLFDFDKVMEANLAEVIGTQDTVLLGRKIYDEWSNYRPKSDDQPFADFINSVHKHVATATPLTREWTNAKPIQGPVDDFVRELKSGDGGDIGVHGSISLTQSLLAAGLVQPRCGGLAILRVCNEQSGIPAHPRGSRRMRGSPKSFRRPAGHNVHGHSGHGHRNTHPRAPTCARC
jgi:dihydrofolate reductase